MSYERAKVNKEMKKSYEHAKEVKEMINQKIPPSFRRYFWEEVPHHATRVQLLFNRFRVMHLKKDYDERDFLIYLRKRSREAIGNFKLNSNHNDTCERNCYTIFYDDEDVEFNEFDTRNSCQTCVNYYMYLSIRCYLIIKEYKFAKAEDKRQERERRIHRGNLIQCTNSSPKTGDVMYVRGRYEREPTRIHSGNAILCTNSCPTIEGDYKSRGRRIIVDF